MFCTESGSSRSKSRNFPIFGKYGQSATRIYNLTNSSESSMHREWHSPVGMTQLCRVSITLGAQVLTLSEFITFTHNIPVTECVWAKYGPRLGQSLDIRRVLYSCHGCMCIIDGFESASNLQYSSVNNSLNNSHFTKPHTYLCSALKGLQLWCKKICTGLRPQ